MTEAEVRERVIVFADGQSEPALTSADLQILVEMARRVDKYGLAPGEDTWTATYDVNFAIAQAWLLKAGRLANRYLFMSGGKMLSRNQYYEHCMEMYYRYAMKSPIKATRLGPESELFSNVPVVNAD